MHHLIASRETDPETVTIHTFNVDVAALGENLIVWIANLKPFTALHRLTLCGSSSDSRSIPVPAQFGQLFRSGARSRFSQSVASSVMIGMSPLPPQRMQRTGPGCAVMTPISKTLSSFFFRD
jgi:hypothetical protein